VNISSVHKRKILSMIIFNKIYKVIDAVTKSFALLAGIVIIFLLITICVSVLSRYFFHAPIGWVVQISEYCIGFIAFLGAAWLEREDGHIKVEIVIGSINEHARHVLDIITSIIGSITCIIITIYGFKVVFDFYQRNVMSVDILETKLWYIYIVIPIGFLFYLFQIIRRKMKHVEDSK